MVEILEYPPKYQGGEKRLITDIKEFKDLLDQSIKFEAFVHLNAEQNAEIAKLLGHWARNEDIMTIESDLMQDEVRHSPKAYAEFGDLENAIEIKGDRKNGIYLELRGPGKGPESFKGIKQERINQNSFRLVPDEEAFLKNFENQDVSELSENGRGLYICAQLALQDGYELEFYTEEVDGKEYHGYILRTNEELAEAA